MQNHPQIVNTQFDSQAEAYLHSAVHAQGPDLLSATAHIHQHIPSAGTGLDIGCGAGHLSFALAPHIARITALDPSAGMLVTVREAADARGLSHIDTQIAQAERLPYADAQFCFVASRYSAHHWDDVEQALREARRVLKSEGYLLIIDIEAPVQALVDTHLQAMELLRDRSHVRNRSAVEWHGLIAAAGFVLQDEQRWPTRLEFSSWIARMRTPASHATMIRTLQREAPSEVREALVIEEDGSFTVQTALYWCKVASR